MAKQQTYDATKMGPLSWRQLQLANQEAYANLDIDDDLRSALQQVTNNMSIPNSGSPEINWEGRVQSPIMRNSNGRDYWGKSIWDEQVADANDFENNLSDLRGQNQPWYAQLGAGLLKGVTTAATTWLDGTVGLLYGIGAAAGTALFDDKATGWDAAAKIFHNSVSDSLQDFNEFMEEFAPNYKSRDEENNKWYQNMGTMNFWADGLIKNLGFTVGAFYSGGAWTKAIKGVGGLIAAGKAGKAAKAYKAAKIEELMKANPKMTAEEAAKAVSPMATAIKYTNALKSIEGARSGTGIAVAGSLFSAVNEGRIEANQVYRDAFTLGNTPEESKGAAAEILAARNRKMQEIEDDPTLLPSEKQALQAQVQANSQKLLAEAEQNAAKAGMLTLGLNIPILTIDNFKMYGRLYSRGFKQSVKQVGNNVTTQELKAAQDAVKNATTKQEKEAAKRALKEAERKAKAAHNARNNARIDDVAENVTDKEGRLAWNEITKGQAAWKGIKSGLMEGNEEMMQAWASGTAGNMTMPEDPDAYYKALTDPNATVKTNDFLTSVTKGFLDSYGNGDRWEEGAIGFLTGILGMPTFGARANSDSNTYLGRGKMIGLSGGFFGEFSNANYLNRLGAESVKNINAFRDKYRQHAQFLAQSQAFTDAMDGYLQDKNEFAYNNVRDNDDYAMIQALAVTGRIDEVKAMLNFKEEDLTDDILDSIARDFTANNNIVDSDGNPRTVDENGKPLQGAWIDKAGNLMSRTKEGKAEMKAKLLEKQKRLNEEIDDYVSSLDSVRAQVNNSLDESQVRELAWLDWKNKQWSRRFQDMQGEQAKAFEFLINKATDEMKDLKPESDTYKALSNFKELIEKAQKAKSPIELLSALAKNNAFLDAMSKKVGKVAVEQEGGIYQIADEFLGDLITSDEEGLSAIETVGKALGDIRLMAIAQKQFKEKLDEYTSNPSKLAANRQKIENERQQQQDITQGLNRNNELSNTKLSELLSPDLSDEEFQSDFEEFKLVGSKDDVAVYQEAKKIRDLYNATVNSIRSDSKLSNEQKNAAVALLSKAKSQCTSFDNFKDLSAEAYNNPDNLKDVATGETEEDYNKSLNTLLENSQQVLQEHLNAAAKYSDLSPEDIENSSLDRRLDDIPTTGNSEVATTSETENERINREEETKAKEDAEKKREQELRNYIWEEILIINNTPVFDRAVKDKLGDLLVRIALTPEVGIRDSILKGINKYTIIKGAIDSDLFKEFMSTVSANDKSENGSITEYFNKVAISKLYIEVDNLYNPKTIAEKEAEEKKKQQSTKSKEEYERENPITITISEEEASKTDENVVDREPVEGEYKYWKPTTSEFGFGRKGYQKANYTKFYERAKNMGYSKQQLKRIEEVGKYFEEHDVWNRVNLGQVNLDQVDNKKNVVQFVIDPELNKAAGEIVILMTDKNGNVIGDVMSKNDPRLKSQDNLTGFVDWVEEEYKKFEKEHPNEKFIPTLNGNPVSTHISKWMIGKIPYSEQFITLNEAVGTDSSKFKLGIAVRNPNSGKIEVKASAWKVGALKPIDLAIIQPLEMQAGQPFLLVRSEGRGAYMCVPIVTPLYDRTNKNTIDESPYGGVIRGAIANIQKVLNDEKTDKTKAIYRIKDILANVFATDTFYISYNPSTKKWSFKVLGSQFYETTNTDFSVDVFLNSIVDKNLGLQISRNFINRNQSRTDDTGKQINFNRVLGSIAKVNITSISTLTGNPEASLHTIDDWFVTNMLKVEKDSSGNIKITEIKATAPRSTKTNPNAAPKQSTTVTIGKKTYEVDLNHHKVNGVNVRTTKDKELKVAYAVAWCRATNKKGIVKVPDLGEFNTGTNQFTGSSPVKQTSNKSAEALWGAANTNSFESEFEEPAPTTTTQTTTEQQPTVETKQEQQFNPIEWSKDSSYRVSLTNLPNKENITDAWFDSTNGELNIAVKHLTNKNFCYVMTYSVDRGKLDVQVQLNDVKFNELSEQDKKAFIKLTDIGFLQESGIEQKLLDKYIPKDLIEYLNGKAVDLKKYDGVFGGAEEKEKIQNELESHLVDKYGIHNANVTATVIDGKPIKDATTTPQVSEQAPSTEISKEEEDKIIKDNSITLPKQYPSNGKNLGDNSVRIYDITGKKNIGREDVYRVYDVNGNTAKYEVVSSRKNVRNWSSILDNVADRQNGFDPEEADTLYTVEEGTVKKREDGNWQITKKAKVIITDKSKENNGVFTDSQSVEIDLKTLKNKKESARKRWEAEQRQKKQASTTVQTETQFVQHEQGQLTKKPLLDMPIDVRTWMQQNPGKNPTSADLFPSGEVQKALGNKISAEEATTDLGITLIREQYEGGYKQIAVSGNDRIEQSYYPDGQPMSTPKFDMDINQSQFKDFISTDENGFMYMDENGLFRNLRENAISKQEEEQKPVENPVQLPTAQEVLDNKGAEYLDKGAEDSGLFEVNKGKGKKVWDSLTDEQKNIILSATNPKSIVDQLSRKLKNGKFHKSVDIDAIINNAKYSRVTEEEREVWNREKELAWLKKALPQLSNEQRVQIVDGLIKITDKDNPGYAWGQFYRGLITISSEAASGTLYHEAFHAVIDLLMTEDEYNKLFDAAYQVWGNLGMLGLEEKLAEEFRKFVQYGDNAAFVDYDAEDIKTPIIRGIVRLFRRLKALIQGLSNKQIYLNKLFYDINKGKFADRRIKENKLDKVTTRQEEDAQLVLDRNPELASVGTAREYAAYVNDIFPNSVEKDIYWHGSNEDFSDGFNTAKRGEGSGALETKKRNDLYLNKQGWASLQYVNGINRTGSDKNGFAHWNKLWWELKEIMSNGRRENNDWKDIVITDNDVNSIRQAIPNKRGKFDRDKGGTHGKWLKERKADYGYENKSDKEFFEEVFGLQLGKDTFNTWTARNAEVFKAMETTAKGIYPVVINVTNPIVEQGQNTYYEEQRGLFSQADRNGNDAILSRSADNEFNSDVAVVINANNKNVHWLGTKSDIEQFKQWKAKNVKQPKFDINERELEDIKKKAIADGTFMKAPNGNPTNLNERQWLQVRTKAFKNWFGDWEKLAVINSAVELANKNTIQHLSFNDFLSYIDNRIKEVNDTLNKAALDYKNGEFKNFPNWKNYFIKSTINPLVGYRELLTRLTKSIDTTKIKIKTLDDKVLDEYGASGLTSGYNGEVYLSDRYKNNLASLFIETGLHEIIHTVTLSKYRVDTSFKEEVDDIYDYIKSYYPNSTLYGFSSPTEMLAEIANPSFVMALSKIPSRKNKTSILEDIIELIKKAFNIEDRSVIDDIVELVIKNPQLNNSNDVSKVVDENGEPLVVYHGTRNKFTTFDKEKIGSKRPSYHGRGFYFTPSINYAKGYSGFNEPLAVFLNIKNPNIYKGDYKEKENTDGNWVLDTSVKSDEIKDHMDEIVVFNPNQIKSAIDNVGTFSRENDDIRYSRVKTELDNKVAEFAEAINKSIAETMTLNRYAQNWDYTKNIPLRKPDASDNDGRKAYFGIKNPMHFYKGQWTISNGAAKYGGKDYHDVVKNEVFKRLAMVGMLDKFNALFDVTWNDATNHYVISLKAPEKIATLSEIVDFDSIPDDVLADMIAEEEKQAKEYSKNREKEILDGATKHTTILFEGKTKIGLGKLFENMISAGVNRNRVALYRNVLDKLGELKDVEVEIADKKDSRFSNGKAAGWYFPSSNNIVLLNSIDDSFLEDTIVHEALHAIVANTVKDKEKSDKVVAIVEGIKKAVLEEYGVKSIDDIQDSGTRRLFYGLTNADEFISEFFSNSQFHDYVKNKQTTWYNRFIDIIKSILGLDVDITKAVKDLLSDFNGQIQEVRQTISMQNQLGTIFRDIANLSKQAVRPQENTEKQEPSIKQYHIQNLMYENLSEEDKEYIKEKGLSKEEYDDFSMTEKENLWYCR